MATEQQVTATAPPAFVDWTRRDSDQKATGTLLGRTVTVTGVTGLLGAAELNGGHDFGTSSFTPPLSESDAIELVSRPTDQEFKVDFGAEVQDAVFHLGSLGSIMTFDPGTTVTLVSGDEGFKVPEPNVVTGVAKSGPPTDSNGTVRVSRPAPFRSIKFKLRLNFIGDKEGVMLQFGL